MSHDELETLLVEHDRWSAYDALRLLLFAAFGVGLVIAGTFLVWSGHEGGSLIAGPGAILAIIGLHDQPYQAR